MTPPALPDARAPLPPEQAAAAFATIMDGGVGDEDIARFLVQLADRGETVPELVAAARALRERMIPIEAPEGAIDVCGTGGDGKGSLNVSTAVAIVVAACGVPVAKHGNRAASSRSGAADVLAALGLDLDKPPAHAEATLAELGIAFLFAANHHPAMARVAGVRRALGRRTIFNLLGPLANPAEVKRQLVGVFAHEWTSTIARVLIDLGSEATMVVHGLDGLDELTVSDRTKLDYIGPSGSENAISPMSDHERVPLIERGGKLPEPIVGLHHASIFIDPRQYGLARHPPEAIQGGDAAYNAGVLTRLLVGDTGAYRDIVLLNTAAALLVAGVASGWHNGVAIAAAAIDTGAARDLLARWIAFA